MSHSDLKKNLVNSFLTGRKRRIVGTGKSTRKIFPFERNFAGTPAIIGKTSRGSAFLCGILMIMALFWKK
ncbi:hypothetical protein DLM78_04140 [Leptospira stimsonii]|uniref:Uncharacterized protein n=1 Tax=Leptospira stimsonii TaxID=2202203 RepID=A0A8B3CX68_9LEPT|nr:hypothetical protein DLM78_04140 [Leptospira stimsonii]